MELRLSNRILTLDKEKVIFVLSKLANKNISNNTNESELIKMLEKYKLITSCFLENINKI